MPPGCLPPISKVNPSSDLLTEHCTWGLTNVLWAKPDYLNPTGKLCLHPLMVPCVSHLLHFLRDPILLTILWVSEHSSGEPPHVLPVKAASCPRYPHTSVLLDELTWEKLLWASGEINCPDRELGWEFNSAWLICPTWFGSSPTAFSVSRSAEAGPPTKSW